MRYVLLAALLIGAPLRGEAPASEGATGWPPRQVYGWTNQFVGTGLCRIKFRDTAMYQQGEPVFLSTTDGSPLRVMSAANEAWKQVAAGQGSLNLKNLPVGYYFVESGDDRAGFAVLPNGWRAAPWLGGEGLANVNWNWEISRVYTTLQFQVVRITSCQWYAIQTNTADDNPANWQWRLPDEEVARAGRNTAIIMPCTFAPIGIATNPAVFWNGWKNYVGAIMTRYKSVADRGGLFIEIWNEPWVDSTAALNFPFDHGKNWAQAYTNWMSTYCDLVETTDMVRVQLGSKAKLIGPTVCGMEGYEDLFRMLAKREEVHRLAALSWHDYSDEVIPSDFTDFPWNLRPGTTQLSMIHTLQAITGTMPLIIDEFGSKGVSALSERNYTGKHDSIWDSNTDWFTAQNRALKRILVYLTNGATVIVPHCFYRQPNGTVFEDGLSLYQWERSYRGMKPKAAAILMLAWWTRGYSPVGCKIVGKHVDEVFAGLSGKFRVFTWAKEGVSEEVPLPNGAVLKDIYGNLQPHGPLTDEVSLYDLSSSQSGSELMQNLP